MTIIIADLKLDFAPLAGPAGTLDLEHRLAVGILDGEPGVDETQVLLHVAHHCPRWTLDLNLLETAEAAPGLAAQRTLNVDHLQTERHHSVIL